MTAAEDADVDAVELESFDPHYLIDEYLAEEAPLRTRVSVAATIRNPHASAEWLGELTGVAATTIRNATAAYFYDAMADRGQTSTGENTPYDRRNTLGEWTPKQQAIIEFFARWPDAVDDDGLGWSWNDVVAYITARTGKAPTTTYTQRIYRRASDFIDERRETLREQGKLDDVPDEPEQVRELPTTLYQRVAENTPRLPDNNLDAGTDDGVDGWAKPYKEANLNEADEADLPHTDDGGDSGRVDPPIDPNLHSTEGMANTVASLDTVEELEAVHRAERNGPNREEVLRDIDAHIAMRSDNDDVDPEDVKALREMSEDGADIDVVTEIGDDDTITRTAGNASYEGPATGVSAGARPLQTIDDAPAWNGDDEDGEDDVDVEELLADPHSTPEEPDVDDATPTGEAVDIGKDGDEDEPSMGVLGYGEAAVAIAPPTAYRDAFDDLEERVERRLAEAKHEHGLQPTERTAGKCVELAAVLTELRELRPDDGGVDE